MKDQNTQSIFQDYFYLNHEFEEYHRLSLVASNIQTTTGISPQITKERESTSTIKSINSFKKGTNNYSLPDINNKMSINIPGSALNKISSTKLLKGMKRNGSNISTNTSIPFSIMSHHSKIGSLSNLGNIIVKNTGHKRSLSHKII